MTFRKYTNTTNMPSFGIKVIELVLSDDQILEIWQQFKDYKAKETGSTKEAVEGIPSEEKE